MSIGQAKKYGSQNFKEHWGTSLLVILLAAAATLVATIFGLVIGGIIIAGPATVGAWYVLFNGIKGEKMEYKDMLHPIKTNFGEVMLGVLIKGAFVAVVSAVAVGLSTIFAAIAVFVPFFGIAMIVVVWILACIAIIIISLYLGLVEYILMREENVKGWDAVKRSKRYMTGNKGRLFGFELSFIGWAILTAIFFPVFIYYAPYYLTSKLYFLSIIYEEGLAEDARRSSYYVQAGEPVNFGLKNAGVDGEVSATEVMNNLCGRLR